MKYAETGYNLEVNLSRGSFDKLAHDPEGAERYLGGQGTAAKNIWDMVPPEIEPFSPGNLLVFSAGLLCGTPVPGANRTSVSSINPQTNLHVSSGFGGFFGPELKFAGYDSIIIRGKSPELVYLWIHNDTVEIRDAGHLQGKSALETAALIQLELKDPNVQVAAIGLAGENRVCQASIEHANSSASRGVGVIMGDKRLKAIAVRGTGDISVARPAELFEKCNSLYQEIYNNPYCGDVFLNESDDSRHVNNPAWNRGDTRVKGFWSRELDEDWAVAVESEHVSYQWENYSQEMEEVHETVIDRSTRLRGTGCYNCIRDCHQAVSLPGKRTYFLKNYSRLAYAMAAYEDLKLNYDLLAAMQNYGIDEFSMPQLLDFVVKLHHAGILGETELPGFPADSLEQLSYLIEIVARRAGVGDLLAKGLYQAACEIGNGSEAYVHEHKKVEHIPLPFQNDNYAYFLMYATGQKMNITQIEGSFPQSPLPDRIEREAFVNQWEAAPERFKKWFLEWEPGQQQSIEAAVNIADWNEGMHYVDDALGICPFLSSFRGQYGGAPPFHLHNLPGLVALATGMELDSAGLWAISTRNRQLVRAINARRGLRRADEEGEGEFWSLQESGVERQLLDAYYEFRGWTSEGIPAKESLDRLGLNDVSEELFKRGMYGVSQ
ncbi:MAG: aldehyde ferredoxin oxidoreductase N-terminal domain-containing protein [Desulfuromonadaceae bacterium]